MNKVFLGTQLVKYFIDNFDAVNPPIKIEKNIPHINI
jgi:hypothetical protein